MTETARARLRAEPARRDVVVRARDVLSELLCTSRWEYRGEPVCGRHGFAWPEDRDLCNYYPEPQMHALTILSELANTHSRERTARRALVVRFGDLADWHEDRVTRLRRALPLLPERRKRRERAAFVHEGAASRIRRILTDLP